MDMTTIHDVGQNMLALICLLPDEPTGPQHIQFSMHIARVHSMSASDNAKVLHEFFEATHQLGDLRKKLVIPMGPDATMLALSLLGWLMNGSKRTMRAIICTEMLIFMRWVIQNYGPQDELRRGEMALCAIVCHCCEPHPREFQNAFMEASPEDFVAAVGNALSGAAALNVLPRSLAFQSVRFIRHLITLVQGDARKVVLEYCRVHIWPVIVNLLMTPQIPNIWLVDDVPFEKRGPRVFDADEGSTFPSFLGALIYIVSCFIVQKIVRTSETCGSADNADSDRQIACISTDLRQRLIEFSESPRFGKGVQSFSFEVIMMCGRSGRGLRRARQARLEAYQKGVAPLRKEEAMDFTFCGYAQCGAQETISVKFQKCSGCNLQSYCSKVCQKKDWKHHKLHCQKS